MAGEPSLKSSTVGELRALAKEKGVDLAGAKTKAQILKRLEEAQAPEPVPAVPVPKAEAPASVAPAPEPSHGEVNRALFATASLSALKGIAKAFGLAVKGSRKPAYIDALVVHPRSDEMAEALRDLGAIAQDTKEVEAVGRDLQAIAERVRMPEVRDAEADALLDAALNASVDFAGAEDHLDQAHRWFESRLYDKTSKAAEEALSTAWLAYDAFLNSVWAHSLLAAQHMLVDAAQAGANVDRAAPILLEAKRLFREGKLAENRGVVVKLSEMVQELYTEEMRLAREFLAEKREVARQAQNLGADVVIALEVLDEASKAATAGEHKRAMTLASKAEEMAKGALAAKRDQVGRQLETVSRAVDATKKLGADVMASEEALASARRALDAGQLLTAGEFVSRAELEAQRAIQARAGAPGQGVPRTLGASPTPPGTPTPPPVGLTPEQQKVADAAAKSLRNIAPVFEEADHYGIDVTAGRGAAAEAQQLLGTGAADAALVAATRASEASKGALRSILIERQKEGIAKPAQGECGRCHQLRLEFFDDGWGRCLGCGNIFRWRQLPASPGGLLGRFRKK